MIGNDYQGSCRENIETGMRDHSDVEVVFFMMMCKAQEREEKLVADRQTGRQNSFN